MTYVEDLPAAGGTLPRKRDLVLVNAGTEAILQDPETGHVHFLNETAALVWECCDARTTVGECADRLRSAYEVPIGYDLVADVAAAVRELTERNLLEAQRR